MMGSTILYPLRLTKPNYVPGIRTFPNSVFFYHRQNKRKRFILSDKLHPQTISCVKTRAEPFEIKIEVENVFETDFTKKDISGVIFQYPDTEGNIHNFTRVVQEAQANGTMTVAATDLMALTILKPPGTAVFFNLFTILNSC